MHHIIVVYAAPIPVGHRVDIRWYTRTSTGLLGGKSEKMREHEPVITDLDTGIEYTSDHAHEVDGLTVKSPDQPVAIAPQPTGQPFRRLLGHVRACRVVHIRRFQNLDVQTDLMIEPAG
jgi:hypothetical protein